MMSRLRTALMWVCIVPLYLAAVSVIVVSKYLFHEEIDTGPPEHIRH